MTTWQATGVMPGLFGLAAVPFAIVWQRVIIALSS